MKTQMSFNNEIEKTKKEIEVLTAKLALLEEMENHKTTCEEAYKRVYGKYPVKEVSENLTAEDNWNVISWSAFQEGYEQAQKDYKVGEYQETAQERGERLHKDVERVVKENLEWFEENPDKDPLDWVNPQTPEETERGMRQQTENWKEIQKLIDEEDNDNDKNFKNSLDLIKEWGEKNKTPTLYQLIEDWWSDIFCANSMDDMETCIDGLVYRIDKKFIPPSSDRNGYEWEKCLKIMREKLR